MLQILTPSNYQLFVLFQEMEKVPSSRFNLS